MNIEFFKQQLKEKEGVLLANIAHLEDDARAAGEPEAKDSTDAATSSQATSESLQEATLASQMLIQVRAALDRADHGTFGHCLACGRAIEVARLEASPWALYCLEDQKKLEATEAPYLPSL
jgi:DnaK suppressor protein